MKSVLITGAGGFLGQRMIQEFHERGWKVLGIGTTPPPPAVKSRLDTFWPLKLPCDRLKTILQAFPPHVVVHCAGKAAVGSSFQDPADDFHSGPLALFELLDNIHKHSPLSRVVFLSSAAVYGMPRTASLSEEQPPEPI